jgi:cytochrome c556
MANIFPLPAEVGKPNQDLEMPNTCIFSSAVVVILAAVGCVAPNVAGPAIAGEEKPNDEQRRLEERLPTSGTLARPAIGERPSPAEALRAGEIEQTRMRPPEGSASGGQPDIPASR